MLIKKQGLAYLLVMMYTCIFLRIEKIANLKLKSKNLMTGWLVFTPQEISIIFFFFETVFCLVANFTTHTVTVFVGYKTSVRTVTFGGNF